MLLTFLAVPQIIGTYSLAPAPLDSLNPFLLQTRESAKARGLPIWDQPGIGSGLRNLGGGRFLSVTDRGPNGDKGNDKYFTVPTFAPCIIESTVANSTWKITKSIFLRDKNGNPVSGLPNSVKDGIAYANKTGKEKIAYDPNGLDTEDIQMFRNGQFALVEEYGPSLLIVDKTGTIQMRYVPSDKFAKTDYPLRANLPKILSKRRINKGFESLAISPTGIAWAILQAPLGDDKNSRIVRVLRFDLSQPLAAKVTGMFAIQFSDPKSYSDTTVPNDISFSAAEWLQGDSILLVERCKTGFRVLKADFEKATNLLNTPAMNSTTIESNPKAIKLATTTLLLSSKQVPQIDSMKIEGVTAYNAQSIALISDNDFAINGASPTKIWMIQLPNRLAIPKSSEGASGGS